MNREEEILTILQEECAEVIQAISKIKRFGLEKKNIKQLEKELGDFLCLLRFLHEDKIINIDDLFSYAEDKSKKLDKYPVHLRSNKNEN